QLDGTLSASVPLIAPAGWIGVSAAKRQREAIGASYESTLATVLVRVAQAYYAAAGADELLKVRRHRIDVAQETLENVKARFESGMVNRVEVTRAELALLRAEQQEVEAGDVREQTYRALKTVLALDEAINVTPPAEASAGQAENAESLVKRAKGSRP